jgi:hypothetical protein
VLDSGKFKIKVLADLMSDEDLLSGLRTSIFFLYTHMVEGARDLPKISFVRALLPFMR